MSELRASSLPLLMKCTGSLTLPYDYTKSENAEKGATWGTLLHTWVQTGLVRGPKQLCNLFEKALDLSGMRGRRLEFWPEGGSHEGEVSVFVGGMGPGEAPEIEVTRRAIKQEGWVTGHYDYQHWFLDGELWIDDLKTGKYYPNPLPGSQGWNPDLDVGENRFPQDPKSAQLKTYALAISELEEYKGDVWISVTHWPRLPLIYRHAPPTRLWHRWSHADLMGHWTDLKVMYATHEANQTESSMILDPGDHCRFCPARNACLVAKEFE